MSRPSVWFEAPLQSFDRPQTDMSNPDPFCVAPSQPKRAVSPTKLLEVDSTASPPVVVNPPTAVPVSPTKTPEDWNQLCFPPSLAPVQQRPAVSRTGSDLQRWGHTVEGHTCRLTCGCIPLLRDGSILLVSTKKDPHQWVLPKGGWEQDEALQVSALRETFEEAGITGILGPALPSITYETRKAKRQAAVSHTHNCMTLFPLYVQHIFDEWPEGYRQRQVVSLEEAIVACEHRPEFQEALRAFQSRGTKVTH